MPDGKRVYASDLIDCAECLMHYYGSPFLLEACASVGIERGKPTSAMLRSYLTDYHRSGHRGQGEGSGDEH